MNSTRLAPQPPSTPIRTAVGALIGVVVLVVSWNSFDRVGGPPLWIWPSTVVVAAASVALLPRTQALLPHPVAMPILLLGATAAIYGCVPETDQIPQIALAVVALAVVELIGQRALPWVWHTSAFALVLWTGIYGATGRDSALVGALFAMWPLTLLPVLTLVVPRLESTRLAIRWVLAAIAIAATLIVARTGALEPTIGPALAVAALCAGASANIAVVLAVTARPAPRRR